MLVLYKHRAHTMTDGASIASNTTLFKSTTIVRTPSHAYAVALIRALESFYQKATGKALSTCGPDNVPAETISVIIRTTGEFSYILEGDEEMAVHFAQKHAEGDFEDTLSLLTGGYGISKGTASRLILNILKRERVVNAREILRELMTLPENDFNTNTLDALEALHRTIEHDP
jgi:hypothetical protein